MIRSNWVFIMRLPSHCEACAGLYSSADIPINTAEVLPESVLICGARSYILQRARPPSKFINQLVSVQICDYEPGDREFESLRARQNSKLIQALTAVVETALCFNHTNVAE